MSGAKTNNTAMLQEPADETLHTNIFGESRNTRPQATNAPHHKIDLNAGVRRLVKLVDRFHREVGAPLPARLAQAVQNIGLHLLGLHRLQMMRRDDALAQLLQPGIGLQLVTKFRLAEQENLQQRLIAQLKVGQHA